MIDYIILIPILASFLITYLLIPYWIKKTHSIGLVWDDMNKLGKQKTAGSAGIIVILGFAIGVLMYISYKTFILSNNVFLIEILALLCSMAFLAGIGFIDDLFGWQKGGLRRRHRIILAAIAAVPLIAINAGRSVVWLPFTGVIELGLIYPLFLIPLGIVGATTTYNFLAGFNGLEAGNGIILLTGLGIVSYFTGNSWISVLCLCMIASLVAFMFFNFEPAKAFPGDVLTYSIGGMIAIVAIIGNFEMVAIFFFIPVIIETILKSRGKLVKQSFGLPKKDGSLDLRYDKVYSLNHLMIFLMKKYKIKPTERRVVYLIWLLQALVVICGLIIFREGIFL